MDEKKSLMTKRLTYIEVLDLMRDWLYRIDQAKRAGKHELVISEPQYKELRLLQYSYDQVRALTASEPVHMSKKTKQIELVWGFPVRLAHQQ